MPELSRKVRQTQICIVARYLKPRRNAYNEGQTALLAFLRKGIVWTHARLPKAQYCELKQRWEAPLVPGEEMGPADQPFGQNPQSVALAQRVRAVADGAS